MMRRDDYVVTTEAGAAVMVCGQCTAVFDVTGDDLAAITARAAAHDNAHHGAGVRRVRLQPAEALR